MSIKIGHQSEEDYIMEHYDDEGFVESWIGSIYCKGGWYMIAGGLHFALKYKPSLWNRFWTRLLLGWVWKSKEKTSAIVTGNFGKMQSYQEKLNEP